MYDILAMLLQTPKVPPLILWGDAGVGKTERLETLAHSLGYDPVITLTPSDCEPQDLVGWKWPSVESGTVSLLLPDWIAAARAAVASGKRPLVFYDEASNVRPATHAAMLRLLKGDTLAGCVQIAAANPPDSAADGSDFSIPTATRFGHLLAPPPSKEDWASWQGGAPKPLAVPRITPEDWELAWPQAHGLVTAYHRFHPEGWYEANDKFVGRFPPSLARPRTWHYATRAITTALAASRSDALADIAGAFVGVPIGNAFATYAADVDLPDPEAILSGKLEWSPDKKRPDRAFALMNALASAAVQKRTPKETQKRQIVAWGVIKDCMPLGKDLCAVSAETLAQQADVRVFEDPMVEKCLQSLAKLLSAAHGGE